VPRHSLLITTYSATCLSNNKFSVCMAEANDRPKFSAVRQMTGSAGFEINQTTAIASEEVKHGDSSRQEKQQSLGVQTTKVP